ncbi:MAG: hypothetical protein LBD49_00270 [Oscillospiraceae bacterium]|jgi:acetyl-CoA carboxylase biotin carboxyl carrier protein|nr:hypothetical protein [Oscillospiraceae bacterium]
MTEIKQLADLLSAYGLTRLEYEKDGLRIALERRADVLSSNPAPAARFASSEPASALPERAAGTPVKAPLVGVVYAARSPGAPPFVTLGQRVKKGDPLCVIEAMKTFSELPSPCDGAVSEILFEDGQLAEYGAVLLVVG